MKDLLSVKQSLSLVGMDMRTPNDVVPQSAVRLSS